MIFRSEFWAREQKKTAGERDHCQISRKAAEEWNKLSDEDRVPYRELAELAKQRHAETYPTYKYSPAPRKESSMKPPPAKQRPAGTARATSRKAKAKTRRGSARHSDENADTVDYDHDASYKPSTRRFAPYPDRHSQPHQALPKIGITSGSTAQTPVGQVKLDSQIKLEPQVKLESVVEEVHEYFEPKQQPSAAELRHATPSPVASKSRLSLQSHTAGEVPSVNPSPESDSSSPLATHPWDIALSAPRVEPVGNENFSYDFRVDELYGMPSDDIPDEMEQLLEYYS